MPSPTQRASVSPAPHEIEGGRTTLSVSHEFFELVRRLKAFETLVQKGRHEKAAVVAADLQRTIAEFDPRRYFPEMFAEFAALYHRDVEVLARHLEQRDSPAWGALDQFYRVDLKAFVET